MTGKKRSASSSRWLQEHFSDKYVQQAQKKGLRSRAWFKLDEIQQSDKLFKPGMTVVDLGAAPGGWSQYVVTQIGGKGRIIACDLLPMDPIVGVDFLQGDFRDELVMKALLERVGDSKVQVVMSDMAPNMSEHRGGYPPRHVSGGAGVRDVPRCAGARRKFCSEGVPGRRFR